MGVYLEVESSAEQSNLKNSTLEPVMGVSEKCENDMKTIQAGVISRSPNTVQDVWFGWVAVLQDEVLVWTETASEGHYDKQEAINDMQKLVEAYND